MASKRSGEKTYLIDLAINDDPKPVENLAKKFLDECAEWFQFGDREFGNGDVGGDMLLLEKTLKMKKPGSTFDEDTEAALRKWQKKKRLKVTGKVDEATIKKLLPRTY